MISGAITDQQLDALFINSPLKNYDVAPRLNDFTLPVLGLGYIATTAAAAGFNVGVLDSESLGLGISEICARVNALQPRWVGLNLLAPTYKYSVAILRRLNPEIKVMVGGHQAKAMPTEILRDRAIPRIDALVLGEADLRVPELLAALDIRERLPGIEWRGANGDPLRADPANVDVQAKWVAPPVDELPFVDRSFFADDPFVAGDRRVEANMVGSRGCPYDCSFCGAAISANPDVQIRTRQPQNILDEMEILASSADVSAFRFVDDLFLASRPFMKKCLQLFKDAHVGERFVWDATGRINVLHMSLRTNDGLLDLIADSGCREVALGIESGSERMLSYIDKRLTPQMTEEVVDALNKRGVKVKGYFILGFPTETQAEMQATVDHVHRLWEIADRNGDGSGFRASAFEFRPYPGTPEWNRLMATGRYRAEQLLDYEHVDLTAAGSSDAIRDRDEFNFSVGLQFGEAPVADVRAAVATIAFEQSERRLAAAA